MANPVKLDRSYAGRRNNWRSGVGTAVVEGKSSVAMGIRKVSRPLPESGLKLLTRAPEFFHNVRVQGSSEFHDYETFGSDEHGTFPFLSQTVLSTAGPSMTLLTWQRGFGGEERVEIDLIGSLNSSTGALIASMNVRFYEGATEGTTELEDSDIWNAAIPVNQTGNFDIVLANDEDDWARVIGSVTNQRV
jgi:hypothetical protein